LPDEPNPEAAGEAQGEPQGEGVEPLAPTIDPEAEAALEAVFAELNPDEITGPSGPGWVIELAGYHFYNDDPMTSGGQHVRDTLLKNLREQTIELPTSPGGPKEEFTMEELGIGYGIVAIETRIDNNHRVPNPYYEPPAAGPGGMAPGVGPGLGPDSGRPGRVWRRNATAGARRAGRRWQRRPVGRSRVGESSLLLGSEILVCRPVLLAGETTDGSPAGQAGGFVEPARGPNRTGGAGRH
jgi:hypothetical protein